MKIIQITIDDSLLAGVDRVVSKLGTTRSAFLRDALQSALRQHALAKLEARHAAGYTAQPMTDEEQAAWASVRDWDEV